MAKILILTVDGGGIKGIIPSYILQQLEKYLNKRCYEMFDIIGGTSTGGIIATALTSPMIGNQPFSAAEVLGIYQNDGDKIFVKQPSILKDEYATYFSDDGNGHGVEPYLQDKFANTSLKGALENMKSINGRTKQVFTTSYTVNSSGNSIQNPVLGKDYGPYLFNWQDSFTSQVDNYYVWEAARATSSAPVYFPVASLGGGQNANSNAAPRCALDGGVMSNNPAVWAISEAFRTGLAKSMSDIVLVSLGTGSYPSGAGLVTNDQGGIVARNGNWGTLPWVLEDLDDLSGTENGDGAIINIITESVQLVSNQQLELLKKSGLSYYRLEPMITREQSKMDCLANVDSLLQTAVEYIQTDGKDVFLEILSVLQSNL